MGEVAYRSVVRVGRDKGPVRWATLPTEPEPAPFAGHGAVARRYRAVEGEYEPMPTLSTAWWPPGSGSVGPRMVKSWRAITRSRARSWHLTAVPFGYAKLPASICWRFQVVSRRYYRGSEILTSNRGFSDWGQVSADRVVAGASLDRLLHDATVLNIRGHSHPMRARQEPTTRMVRVAEGHRLQRHRFMPRLTVRCRPPAAAGRGQHPRCSARLREPARCFRRWQSVRSSMRAGGGDIRSLRSGG